MTERPSWAPDDVDITTPSVARVYDYYLGGSHNFAADREFAAQVVAAVPEVPQMARDNRAFLRRAVRHLCSVGVDQFLDLGAGIPTVGSVHEVAHAVNPEARVVYVDHDPVAVTHSRELLAGDPRILVLPGDLRDARSVLDAAALRAQLDLARPVGVLFFSVLHFIPDDADPAGIVAAYAAGTAAGSHVAISHVTADRRDDTAAGAALYNRPSSPQGVRQRSAAEVAALFGPLAMVDPGLVRLPFWRPESADDVGPDADLHVYYVGVGRTG